MRFCLVSTFYPPYHFGGDAIFVQRLAADLAAEGHHVEVVHCADAFRAGTSGRDPVPAQAERGITVHRLESGLGILSPLLTQQTGRPVLKAGPLERILGRGFDVINFHNISLIGGPDVLRLGAAPVKLYTLHEHWLLCPTHIFWKNRRQPCDRPECFTCSIRSGIPPQFWRHGGWTSECLEHADLLLSPSRFTAERHRAGGIRRPIQVLPSYVDPPRGEGDGSPGPPARPRFVYVGRMVESKGVAWLAERFAARPWWDLDLIGTGPLLDAMQREHAERPSIRFHGGQTPQAVRERMRGATALILPSLAPEVFPLTILEAMAEGTPCIVHRAGGAPEAVEESGAGFVYEDEQGMDEAARRLAGDPDLWRDMSARARQASRRTYSREKYLGGYLAAIEKVMREKSR